MSEKNVIIQLMGCVKSRLMVIPTFTFPALINLAIAAYLVLNVIDVVKLFACVTLTAYAVYWFNDYLDYKDDIESAKFGETAPTQRPLAKGQITKSIFQSFIVIAMTLGLLMALTINLQVFLAQLAFLTIGYLYSSNPIRLKKRFLGKQFAILAGGLIDSLTGALVVGVISPQNVYCFAINFLLYLSGPSLGDIRDYYGDRSFGIKTLPVVIGPEMTVRLAIATFIAVILAGVVGYYNVGFNLALPILTTIIIVSWIYSVYPIINRWKDSNYIHVIVYKRIIPMNILIQLIPVIGMIAL